MLKRFIDILFSLLGLVLLVPLFVGIAFLILLDSRGSIFYRQVRVGRGNQDFELYKFRTMRADSDKKGLLTIGGRDSRITRVGYTLRKFKLDELPQLLNVLVGDMSLVGPRPEVRKYVQLYNQEQLKVLQVRPGITDYASLKYFDENELLAKSSNPEETYIQVVMPAKLELNKQYILEAGLITDIKIIVRTFARIFN